MHVVGYAVMGQAEKLKAAGAHAVFHSMADLLPVLREAGR
jgi:phosphoglycolate phosphatase-like HAD superfamily hydrolase